MNLSKRKKCSENEFTVAQPSNFEFDHCEASAVLILTHVDLGYPALMSAVIHRICMRCTAPRSISSACRCLARLHLELAIPLNSSQIARCPENPPPKALLKPLVPSAPAAACKLAKARSHSATSMPSTRLPHRARMCATDECSGPLPASDSDASWVRTQSSAGRSPVTWRHTSVTDGEGGRDGLLSLSTVALLLALALLPLAADDDDGAEAEVTLSGAAAISEAGMSLEPSSTGAVLN